MAFVYVIFLIVLFKQFFFLLASVFKVIYWLSCYNPWEQRREFCRWNIKGRKNRHLRHFNAFLILIML